MKKSYLYLTISIMFISLIFCIQVIHSAYNYQIAKVKEIAKLKKENKRMKDNITAVGGLGLEITEIERMNIEELVSIYQQRHSLLEYKWKYKEIGYPVTPKMTYITSEYGNRKINGKWEKAKSIDMKQADSLEIKSSINGFVKISQHKIYGNNVIIDGLVVITNELNEKEIKKVEVRLSHLSKILIKNGSWIKKGDIVGYMGNTGRCCIYDAKVGYYREITEYERNLGLGMHLDFEIRIDGYLRNPFANSTFGKQVQL